MSRTSIIVLVIILLALVGIGWLAFKPASRTNPIPTPSPMQGQTAVSPTTMISPSQAASGQTAVKLFFIAIDDNGESGERIGCGDSLVPVTVMIPKTTAVLTGALEKLLSQHSRNYGESGLYNSLYRSQLTLESATIMNGKVTVRLSGSTQLGGECDDPRAIAQLRSTVMQFPTVKSADILINNKPLEQVFSEKGE